MHPTERERVAATMSEAMDGGASYETEFRIVGYDNVERWVMGRGKALRNGRPLRMLGVFVDVTERHRTQRELRELSERLIQGHERERRRLARELHDGVAQRLSMLSMEARLLDRDLAGTGDAARARCADLAAEIAALGNELHRVSYELHPARLEQLGLEAAIRTFCAQIALGFDPTEPFTTDSLGLTSMRERVRLIGGTLRIDGRPGAGTAIEARVVVTGDTGDGEA